MTPSSAWEDFPGAGLALAVLNSVGSVVILRALQSELPLVQMVPDLLPMSPVMNTSMGSFADTHLMRSFRMPKNDGAPSSGTQPPGYPPTTSNAVSSPSVRNFADLFGNTEEMMVGHVLSRGLLCITQLEGDYGTVELVVSTMGHLIVSIAFNATENRFFIADTMITPAAMYFVGFVDFFATGCADLVMASHSTVLVARRSRAALQEKASLLLRLLQARGMWPLLKATESVEI
ncbi:unnamed protein product [Phytomonas sp. EM1]|nr:unnamed protein product [Phytomonas sp. EM1]|eukprot:CCW61362.1 unnamed protein product [Phytomonas sp. isolate EM1]